MNYLFIGGQEHKKRRYVPVMSGDLEPVPIFEVPIKDCLTSISGKPPSPPDTWPAKLRYRRVSIKGKKETFHMFILAHMDIDEALELLLNKD